MKLQKILENKKELLNYPVVIPNFNTWLHIKSQGIYNTVKVNNNFHCHNENLQTLNGCPEEVAMGFYCALNKLTTLEGGPTVVHKNFNCSLNSINTLTGAPKEIFGEFQVQSNKLTSLQSVHKIMSFSWNP